jgi:hypothetical protein
VPDSESFDAFYARTVATITSQMHALAGEDSAADHAIREAYARAYQQWYQVASYPDTEGWLLAVAKEAYQRRRPMAAAPLRDGPARAGHDPFSMPGLFRPATARVGSRGTGDTTLAPPAATPAPGEPSSWFTPVPKSPGPAGAGGTGPARGISGLFGGRARGAVNSAATAQLAGDHPPTTGHPAEPRQQGPGRLAGWSPGRRRPSVTVIALVIVIVLAAAGGIAYLVAAGNAGGHAAHKGTAAHRKPAVQMLAAGRTGTRSAIPWSIVGPGWTLAEVSTAAPGPNGTARGAGHATAYLVDPEGGKYRIVTAGGVAPVLLAWSGDAQNALFEVPPGSAGGGVSYDLLSLTTGNVAVLPLPAGVTAVGFTRPDGLNILAVSQTATAFQLERFNLTGAYQATIGSLPRKAGMLGWQAYCGVACGVLSSPDGLFAVWGVTGDQMQLLSNAGGPVIRRLDVPGSGSPPSCVPLTWWNADTVLASCSVTGRPAASRLWLVPTDGSSPTALTTASGSPSGTGVVGGAWQGPGAVYVTSADAAQCSTAASGPGGLAVARVSGGSLHRISVGGTTNHHTSVVSASGGRLLVLAETSCPGTSALLWLDPATGVTQTVLSAPASQLGVVAAVPYGNGPTALSVGFLG